MGTINRRRFSREFKLEAVKLLDERGALPTAESLGVGVNLLYKWRKELRNGGAAAFSDANLPVRTSLEEENRELRRRIRQLEEEKEILKKAAAYFAKHTR